MVATRDIGWKAVECLENTTPQLREFFDFVGPKEVTMQEVVETFARSFDQKELRYEQISFDQEKQLLLQVGLKPEMAELMVEMEKAFNEGIIKSTQELTREHHGTTTLEMYVEMLAHRSLLKAA